MNERIARMNKTFSKFRKTMENIAKTTERIAKILDEHARTPKNLRSLKPKKKILVNFFDSLHAASATIHDKEIISLDTAYANIKELKLIDPRSL